MVEAVEEGGGAVEVRRRGRRGWRRCVTVGFGPGRQDAFHGPVAGVADGDRPPTRGVETPGGVTLCEADHALRSPQVVQGATVEESVDDLGHARTELTGTGATPRRGAHEERHLLRRVIGVVSLAAPLNTHMSLDTFASDEHLHGGHTEASIDLGADVAPRHRVQRFRDPDVAIHADLGPRPRRQLETLTGQAGQRRRLDRVEHDQRRRAFQTAMRPPPSHSRAPRQRPGLHVGQASPRAATPHRIPHVRHRPFHPGLVLGFGCPCRVDQETVVGGQLGVRPVQFRVIQVGLDHPGLQIVRLLCPGGLCGVRPLDCWLRPVLMSERGT